MKKLTVSLSRTETVIGFIYLAFQLTAMQFLLLLCNSLLGNPLSTVGLNFVFFCLNFLCVVGILHKFLIRSSKQALATPFRCLKAAAIGLALYWLGSLAFGVLTAFLYPEFFNVNDSSIQQMTQQNYILMAIGTVLLVPITEELLYRGLIFSNLYNHNPRLAYLVSTVVFSALHVVGYIGQYEPVHLLLCFLQYMPAALSLGWAYAHADCIWAPILLHITVNQIAILSTR